MAIKFVLLVNKQGQTRVAQYYDYKLVCVRNNRLRCLLSSVNLCNPPTGPLLEETSTHNPNQCMLRILRVA